MVTRHQIRSAGRWLATGTGLAAASYAAYVAIAWHRYGRAPRQAGGDDRDALLDQILPLKAEAERRIRAAGGSPTAEATP
jgi:hypothetical protein